MSNSLKAYLLAVFIFMPAWQFAGRQALLHDAVNTNNLKLARFLLDNGAQVNEENPALGITLLHIAARNSSLQMVKLLLKKGASITAKCAIEELAVTPLVFSTHNADPEIMDLLLSKEKIIPMELMVSMLEYALEGYAFKANSLNNLETIKQLMQHIASYMHHEAYAQLRLSLAQGLKQFLNNANYDRTRIETLRDLFGQKWMHIYLEESNT